VKKTADVNEVAKAIGMDSRIGSKFLRHRLVWRFLFPKDILNLVYIAKSYGLNEVRLLGTNNYMNDIKRRFSNNIVQTLYNTVSDKKLPFWDGLSKDTNDTRSAAIYVG
jgi:UDPglucose 6-dehydrogenase